MDYGLHGQKASQASATFQSQERHTNNVVKLDVKLSHRVTTMKEAEEVRHLGRDHQGAAEREHH